MELTTLYYFSELAKDLNMTRTAQRLFISQQTLSNHIARLEDYYGMKLFNRKPSLSLTAAGRSVLEFAERSTRENDRLKNELSDINGLETGTLRVGGNFIRLYSFFHNRLQDFIRRYPNVSIDLIDMHATPDLEAALLNNSLDIAGVIDTGRPHKQLLYQRVLLDEIFLCVPYPMLKDYYGEEAPIIHQKSAEHGADLRDFARLPYYLFNNVRGRQVNECFEEAGVVPKVVLRGINTLGAAILCSQGVVASFLSRQNLLQPGIKISKDLGIYRIYHDGKLLSQTVCLARNRENYVTQYASYFWELLAENYEALSAVPLASGITPPSL